MPEEPPPPLPAAPPPQHPQRPPVPAWLYVTFGLGLMPVCAIIAVICFEEDKNTIPIAALCGGGIGLILGLPMLGGLNLAGRFFSTNEGRIFGGLLFAVLIVAGVAAVSFAGCLCIMNGIRIR